MADKKKKLTLDQQRQKDFDKAVRAGDQKEIKRLNNVMKSVSKNKAKAQPNPRNMKPGVKQALGNLLGKTKQAGAYGEAVKAKNIPVAKVPTLVTKAEKAYAENLKKSGQKVPRKIMGMPKMGPTASRRKGEPIELQEKLLLKKSDYIKPTRRNMGGAIMKNRGGMFKGSY